MQDLRTCWSQEACATVIALRDSGHLEAVADLVFGIEQIAQDGGWKALPAVKALKGHEPFRLFACDAMLAVLQVFPPVELHVLAVTMGSTAKPDPGEVRRLVDTAHRIVGGNH